MPSVMRIGRVGRVSQIAVVACFFAAALSGCSSKPAVKDIEAELAKVYECPLLEVRDVKRIDGEPESQGLYSVAFSYVVALKGGDAAAAKLLTDWVYLRAEGPEINKALGTPDRRTRLPRDTDGPREKALLAYSDELSQRLGKLLPCEGTPEITAVTMPFYEQAKEAFKPGAAGVVLPVGVRISRVGVMSKAESGWHFRSLNLGFNSFDFLNSQPMQVSLPPSKVAEIMTGPAGDASAERTLVGVVRRGTADSCLQVGEGAAEKCYSLPSTPNEAKLIFAACSDGAACAITGQWDEKNESVRMVSKAEAR
jgi:hypothetical protein